MVHFFFFSAVKASGLVGLKGKPINCQTMAGKDFESQQTLDEPGLNFKFAIKPVSFQWFQVQL